MESGVSGGQLGGAGGRVLVSHSPPLTMNKTEKNNKKQVVVMNPLWSTSLTSSVGVASRGQLCRVYCSPVPVMDATVRTKDR